MPPLFPLNMHSDSLSWKSEVVAHFLMSRRKDRSNSTIAHLTQRMWQSTTRRGVYRRQTFASFDDSLSLSLSLPLVEYIQHIRGTHIRRIGNEIRGYCPTTLMMRLNQYRARDATSIDISSLRHPNPTNPYFCLTNIDKLRDAGI